MLRKLNAKAWRAVAFAIALLIFLTYTLFVIRSPISGKPNNSVTELVVTSFGYPHPYKLSFVAQYRFVHQVCEFLVRRDDRQNITGGLAESWTISSDRRKITFHLRPNLYSAEEAVQSLRRLVREGQTSHSNLAAQTNEERIQASGPLTLTIETDGDAGAILSPLVMADAAILPDDHWITVPGFKEPQIDWTKTKGPYIYAAGKFPAQDGQVIEFIPNPNHYFYEPEQLRWRLVFKPIEKIRDLSALNQLLETEPSFTTVRYWDMLNLFSGVDPGLEVLSDPA